MNKFFKSLIFRSPSLRKLLVIKYRHTHSTNMFENERCVNIDQSFYDAISQKHKMNYESLWTEEAGWGKRISLNKYIHIKKGKISNFYDQKVALIAHYDTHGKIFSYIEYYAKKLKEMGYQIVLTSGNELKNADISEEQNKIFDAIVWRECSGYDFTSWKVALEAFPSLLQAQEIFITNDSIFAPVGDFRPIFEDMEAVPCDLWGLVESRASQPYLQSYGVLFRQTALRHPAFSEFFDRVSLDDSREIALKHELRMAMWMHKNGLSIGAWLPSSALPWPWFNPLHRTWKQLVYLGLPILKRDMFSGRDNLPFPHGWRAISWSQNYPVELIEDYLQQIKEIQS